MTVDEFRATLAGGEPPQGASTPLRALWLDGKGDWAGAHGIAQDVDTGPDAAIHAAIHAYLHRKEGDADNAGYWYRRAGRAVEERPLAEEWAGLVREALAG